MRGQMVCSCLFDYVDGDISAVSSFTQWTE